MDELFSIIANEVLGGDADFDWTRDNDYIIIGLSPDQAAKLLDALRSLRKQYR